MLLKELIKNIPADHPEQKQISQALDAMQQTCTFVNERIKGFEHQVVLYNTAAKIKKLPTHFTLEQFVVPTRRFVKEWDVPVAALFKNEPLDVALMTLFLFSDLVVVAQKNASNDLEYVTHTELDEEPFPWILMLREFPEHKHVFQLVTNSGVITVCAENKKRRSDLVKLIAVVLESLATDEKRDNRATYSLSGTQLGVNSPTKELSPSLSSKVLSMFNSKKSIPQKKPSVEKIVLPPKTIFLKKEQVVQYQTMEFESNMGIGTTTVSYFPEGEQHMDELEYRNGDILLVLNRKDPNWWICMKSGLTTNKQRKQTKTIPEDFYELKLLTTQGRSNRADSIKKALEDSDEQQATELKHSHIIDLSTLDPSVFQEEEFNLNVFAASHKKDPLSAASLHSKLHVIKDMSDKDLLQENSKLVSVIFARNEQYQVGLVFAKHVHEFSAPICNTIVQVLHVKK